MTAPAKPIRGRRLAAPFVLLIRTYQVVLGPFLGGRCRFYPSCSEYAVDAYREHGPFRGTWLTARRLARCHPLGGSGVELVPERRACKGEPAGAASSQDPG